MTIPRKTGSQPGAVRPNGYEFPEAMPRIPSDVLSRFSTLEQYQREQDQFYFQLRDQLKRRDEELSNPINSQLQSAQSAVDALVAQLANVTEQINALQVNTDDFQLKTQRGQANGYASLNAAGQVPPAQLPFEIQTFAIPNGVDQVVVLGMLWPSVPIIHAPVVVKPAGGLNLYATVVDGSITADGFVADLNGFTNAVGYTLAFARIL